MVEGAEAGVAAPATLERGHVLAHDGEDVGALSNLDDDLGRDHARAPFVEGTRGSRAPLATCSHALGAADRALSAIATSDARVLAGPLATGGEASWRA